MPGAIGGNERRLREQPANRREQDDPASCSRQPFDVSDCMDHTNDFRIHVERQTPGIERSLLGPAPSPGMVELDFDREALRRFCFAPGRPIQIPRFSIAGALLAVAHAPLMSQFRRCVAHCYRFDHELGGLPACLISATQVGASGSGPTVTQEMHERKTCKLP
jgi:hypothetical protein